MNSLTSSHAMKRILRNGLKAIFQSSIVWQIFYRIIARPSNHACILRDEIVTERASLKDDQVRDALSLRKVLRGPFSGIIYGNVSAKCSALYPKLLGTYEAELHPFLVASIKQSPQQVIVIGAAEGYYAVGFAANLPKASIVAFEGSVDSQKYLIRLCTLNNLANRVQIKGFCTAQDLLTLDNLPSLILVDCEGSEVDILTTASVSRFAHSDFIVELHDGYRPNVTTLLEEVFADTHKTIRVDAIHDIDRPDCFPILNSSTLTVRERILLLQEKRTQACLRWLVATPKGSNHLLS
jgi:hypothetical protein